jgi:hypothetical protein
MNYQTPPLEITEWTSLSDFDEYEAKAAGWPPALIRDAIQEIQRRELKPQHTHGGARPGAGRKPRKDTRAGRLVRIWLTDQEHLDVLTLSTDERREALLKAAKSKS